MPNFSSRKTPPALDYQVALAESKPREAGHIHYLLGAGAASYAIAIIVFAGFHVAPLPLVVLVLATVAGLTGGWIIREADERRDKAAVTRRAWANYHARRRREWVAALG